MRRLASGPGSAVMLAAAVVVGLLLGACSHGGEHARLSDCQGTGGGPKPIQGTPLQSDVPTNDPANWDHSSSTAPLGQNKVMLRITPVIHVNEFGTDCVKGNASYIVAKIEYANPNDPTAVAEWPSWTDHTKAVYLAIKHPTGNGDFDYAILVPDGSGGLKPTDANPRHGFSWPDATPSAGPDAAVWGVPQEHLGDQNYLARYKEVSGGEVPAPPTQDGSRIHQSLDTTRKLDPLQAGWFGCTQGCCTATNVI